jgi:SAM-dependent methyltransferase
MDTDYTKSVFSNNSIVDYYDTITFKFGLMQSEALLFKKYVSLEHTILDIGCGAGRTSLGLYQLGYKNITGIDISDKMIVRAIKNAGQVGYKIHFQTGDVINLKLPDESFDCAFFSFNGLMLIPGFQNRLTAFFEINRILRTDGYFIFSTPYLDNKIQGEFWQERLHNSRLSPKSECFGDMFLDDCGVHNIYIHIPFQSEIIQMLDKTGFSLKERIRRLDICLEDVMIEDELDDNMFWIVGKK